MIYVMLHCWLKLAEICRDPFDGDHHDISLLSELEHNLMDGYNALESVDYQPN